MLESDGAASGHGSGCDHGDDHPRQDLTYRFATAADLLLFYGELPVMTVHAVAILLNDAPSAVLGIAYGKDCATFFADHKPELEPHLRRLAVMRAIKMAMKLVSNCKRDVYAVRLENTDLVPKLGFEHVEGEVYRWHG